MNILIPFVVFLPLLFGLYLYNVKSEKRLWKTAISVVIIELIGVIALFFAYQSNHDISIGLNMFSGFGINFKLNEFGLLFAIVACILWTVSTICAEEYFSHHVENLNRYYASLLITLTGCLGIFYASDLFTLFVFFEVMSFLSYVWVAQNQDEKSVNASGSYLAYAVIGGLSILFGLFILYAYSGDLSIENLGTLFTEYNGSMGLYIACFSMFIGFGAKAGAFMLHDWLALAHTASPAPASGLLSGLLTKTGVYGIILVSLRIMSFSSKWAMFIFVLSMFNMLFGAICAFFSNDLKRTLAFSSVSQIGFILWGVGLTLILGEHNTIAGTGTIFHMVNHSLIKIVLFSVAGIVYQNVHSLDLNKLQGYGKDKPWLKGIFAVGAMSIMGIPLFSGYVSKTLLHEAVVEYLHLHHDGVLFFQISEWLFLLAGGFTFAYMLKLFICIFVRKPKEEHHKNKKYATKKTLFALSFVCVLLFGLGVVPNITFDKIGDFMLHFMGTHTLDHAVSYFAWANLKGAVISAVIGLVLYFVVAEKTIARKDTGYSDIIKTTWTVECMIYKPLIAFFSLFFAFIARIFDVFTDLFVVLLNRVFFKSVKIPRDFFEGALENKIQEKTTAHITYSLAYSLLLFGVGFMVTIFYLLIVVF